MTRRGWIAGPVRPESAVHPHHRDPGNLGPRTFRFRWPRTHRLLTGEFQLSRDQAWSVARTARRHRSLWRGRIALVARSAAVGLLLSPVLIVFGAAPLWELFIGSTLRAADAHRLPAWYATLAAALAAAVLLGWVLYERLGVDRLIDREIRACWRDRVCLWCRQDMDEAKPRGDRWAVCPECGMRSPVAVRSP